MHDRKKGQQHKGKPRGRRFERIAENANKCGHHLSATKIKKEGTAEPRQQAPYHLSPKTQTPTLNQSAPTIIIKPRRTKSRILVYRAEAPIQPNSTVHRPKNKKTPTIKKSMEGEGWWTRWDLNPR
ncbi:MAG: hypothetical protein ABIK28_21040, partial [Planctomycetota bacterium]